MAGCQFPGGGSACNTQIDWVNFIEVGSNQYVAGLGTSADVLQQGDLGSVYAHVKFKVSGTVCDPNYKVKDGDAAFLDPGTPIYAINGHPTTEQLAARFNGSIVIYPRFDANVLDLIVDLGRHPLRSLRTVHRGCRRTAGSRFRQERPSYSNAGGKPWCWTAADVATW